MATYRQMYAATCGDCESARSIHTKACPDYFRELAAGTGFRCPQSSGVRFCEDCWDREIEEPDLPACPFCGSTNLTEDMDSKGWFIACKGCLTEGPRGKTREEAESRWNRRS